MAQDNNDGADFTSAFDAALRYADRGWPVFPCREDKKPYTEHGFLEATCDHGPITQWWRRWPNAQVGIATEAAGLCVLDLDVKPASEAGPAKDGVAVFSVLCGQERHGCGLVASTPRGGRHYVYLMPDPPVPCGQDVLGVGIDVRACGGYIIAPSPASPGRDWIEGDPFGAGVDGSSDLCALPPWLVAMFAKPHKGGLSGGMRESGAAIPLTDREVDRIRSALRFIPNDERYVWIRVGMALKSTGAREQAYALWETWSRAHPSGCHPKFDPDQQLYHWRSIHEFRHDGSEVAIGTLFHMAKQNGWAPSLDDDVAAVEPPAEPPPPVTKGEPFDRELMNCPGLVGELAAWMVKASTRQQHALCLASALTALGALLGRRVSTPSDLRTNLYCLGIGETASGKDPSIKLPQVLFARAGLKRYIGPGEWKSDSGLRSALIAEPSHVCLLDEFTKMLEGMSGHMSPPHLRGIKRYVLTLFASANGVHLAPAYADRKLNAPVEIAEPNLCIYGTGVPSELWTSLTRGAISDGFLNRFLVFFADNQQPPRRKVGRAEPPADLLAALKALDAATKPPGLQGKGSDLTFASGCRVVPMTEAADAFLERAILENDARIAKMRDQGSALSDLWVRFGEHVAKVALIRTVCDDPTRAIDVQDVEWSHSLVVWCTERMVAEAESRVSDSEQEARTKRVLRTITAAGSRGLTSSQLTRATQWLRRSDRSDILQTLVESGDVVKELRPSKTSIATVYVAAGHGPNLSVKDSGAA